MTSFSPERNIDIPIGSSQFDKNFIWGVSSSALQTEGITPFDGKGLSIWDEFVKEKKIKNNDHHFNASNFYLKYREDIAIIKSLGIKQFRFSFSWSRIIPDGTGAINYKGIDFYHRVIDYCRENEIEPWVTLYHWDLPLSLDTKGGWTNREILNWFGNYVKVCVKEFGAKVKNWMVLNEPLVFTGAGYFAGVHAPGKRGMKNFLPAAHHASLCQAIGLRTIKDLYPDAFVGSTFSASYVSAYSNSKKDIAAATRIDALLNRTFIEPSLGMGYPVETLPALNGIKNYIKPGDPELLKADFDFIGLQVYTREVVEANFFTPHLKARIIPAHKRKVHHTQMNWEVYPASIYEIIKKVSNYSGVKKIIVTENGASFHDEVKDGLVNDTHRIGFLEKYIEQVNKAYLENPKLTGYFIWSLTDNFEWTEGYSQRFGLVYIDYKTQERIIKNSGYWYRDFLMR